MQESEEQDKELVAGYTLEEAEEKEAREEAERIAAEEAARKAEEEAAKKKAGAFKCRHDIRFFCGCIRRGSVASGMHHRLGSRKRKL